MLPLQLLRTGEWAAITSIDGEPSLVARLSELGLRPGATVQMLQPGSPCLLRVGETRIGLRAELAQHLLVQPLGEAPNPSEPVFEVV